MMLENSHRKHSHWLRCSIFSFFFLLILQVSSQPYKNSWINYAQQYYKFPIVNDGIYRIDFSTLNNAGIPLSSIDPRNLQLFGRGEEQYIYVQGEDDGVFNNGDFIEFYALRNDGFLDREMYDHPASQGNPHFSLFTDTAYYFLTWNTSINNRRMANDSLSDFNNYSPAAYFNKKELKYFGNRYYYGETDYYGITQPGYTKGEGWFSNEFNKNVNFGIWLSCLNATTNSTVSISTKSISASNDVGSVTDNRLKISLGNTTLKDTTFDGYELLGFNFNFTPTLLSADSVFLKYESLDMGTVNSGRMAVAFAELKYPHTISFENKTKFKFYLPYSNNARTRIDISAFNNLSSVERLYDLTNHRRIKVFQNGSLNSALIIDNGQERECYLTSDNAITPVSNLIKVNGSGYFSDIENLLSGKKFIVITPPTLLPSANQYASYRSMKGIASIVINVEELYDQFAFGVRKSPLAIKTFGEYVSDNFTDANYFFLLGKSLSSELCRRNNTNFNNNLVPTWGFPASDVLLTSGLNGNDITPAFATGRLAAKSPSDVFLYLDKVQNYETNNLPGKFSDDGEWMKTVLHFAGGITAFEANNLENLLNVYRDTIQLPYFGGNVLTFRKSSTAPIQTSTSDSIRTLVNNGTSIMTFFGHASGSGFDNDLGPPSDFSNSNGKYPLIIGNSCFVGDIHQPSTTQISNSEQWVLNPNGAIAFVAQVGLGFQYPLYLYTSELYSNIARKNYRGSIGQSIKNTINNVQGINTSYMASTALEMTLHGDPAVIINSFPLPDMMVNRQNLSTIPAFVNNSLGTFELKAKIKNLGMAIYDSVDVMLEQIKPGESVADTTFFKTIPHIYLSETITFTVPLDPIRDVGMNNFKVTVDPFNRIHPEISEINNTAELSVNIVSNEVFPIYPYKYAIIPNNKIHLKASTGNPLAPTTAYTFQLDTTDTFISPLVTGSVNASGGIIDWNMNNYTLTDSAVYYWRVSGPSNGGNTIWRESSFQYIPEKRGWGQSHIFQFKNDPLTFMNYNRSGRRWDFSNNAKKITCRTFGNPTLTNQLFGTEYRIDTEIKEYSGCGYTPAVYVAVIDSLNLEAWGTKYNGQNPLNDFGNYNNEGGCRQRVEKVFMYRPGVANGAAQMQGMLDLLTNKIPNGYYVLIFTYVNGNFNAWPQILKDTLQSWGATSIQTIPDNYPYIFFCRKGYRSSAMEQTAVSPNNGGQPLVLDVNVQNNWDYGFITSELAGPASSWHSFHWRPFTLENPSVDSVSVDIIGVKANGSETVLINDISTDSLDILNLNTRINASIYPYLKLRAYTQDDARTPSQLHHWRLYYDGLPEAAVSPNIKYSFNGTNLQEGERVNFSVAVKNISDYDMDSLKIKYWIEDNNRGVQVLPYTAQLPLPKIRQDSLFSGDTLISSVSFDSYRLSGNNTLWMEVNPDNDQPEQFHFNNFISLPFLVERDKENPLLDVTFDGIHILDGDIVSAKPEIKIQLKDENRFLAVNDTQFFRIYLLDPDATVPKRIYFTEQGNIILNFNPAQLPENKAFIDYQPNLVKDGKYKLIVQANDASNNKSGAFDYEINFEVINKSSITEVMNYPNPFSTSTRFVFTMTGSQLPSVFKIQIMNISGKVVKEIFMDELGPLHIGRNITEYAWDGRDEFGDQLANGIYLYKVYTKIGNENIEKLNTNANQFFQKGFGKMYLMR